MLTLADFQWAASKLGCEIAAVQAVAAVETMGKPFLPDGRPVVLFEAHVFSRLTNHDWDKIHKDISSRSWNRSLYATGRDWIERGVKEHARLAKAANLDRLSALQSCSWGMFQVMGFNWQACGYKSVQRFVNAMYKDERSQLEAFVGFVLSKKLDKHLRNKNWDAFAAGYNGQGYKQNRYDDKLEQAYNSYKD